jgi:hypothetical protein
MGSKISLDGRFKNNHDSKCFSCYDKINAEDLVICTRCNISLHNTCYDNICANKNYTICPNLNCNHIGSLGIYMK